MGAFINTPRLQLSFFLNLLPFAQQASKLLKKMKCKGLESTAEMPRRSYGALERVAAAHDACRVRRRRERQRAVARRRRCGCNGAVCAAGAGELAAPAATATAAATTATATPAAASAPAASATAAAAVVVAGRLRLLPGALGL